MKHTRDEVMPPDEGKSWKFDREVTEAFSDMLQRSVPQYDVMRETVTEVAVRLAKHSGAILDLGCSRGDALSRMMEALDDDFLFVGCEISEPMVMACRQRFAEEIKTGKVKILQLDLRKEFPPAVTSVTLSVLTMMFTPIEYRMKIISRVYQHMLADGAFILVEKVLGESADLDQLMVDMYLQMKREQGYTDEQIVRKKLALEGVLVPVTAKWNENLLRSAGFSQVDCFWRWCNFAAWVAIK